MTWLAGRGGRRVELLHPVSAEVDFGEIAWALAHTGRYTGHTARPISVAQHSLIVAALVPGAIRAHALIHDAHEARIGDLATPLKETLGALAAETFGEKGRLAVEGVLRDVAERHDRAIFGAAGLNPLAPGFQKILKLADVQALRFEREHFFGCRPGSPAWADAIEAAPLPHGIPARLAKPMPAFDAAQALFDAFYATLPALIARGGRAPSLANYPGAP